MKLNPAFVWPSVTITDHVRGGVFMSTFHNTSDKLVNVKNIQAFIIQDLVKKEL